MSRHKFKVGDIVSYPPFEGENWVVIGIQSLTTGIIAYKESIHTTWKIDGREGYPPEYIEYNGWHVELNELTLIIKANPIWLNNIK